MNTEKIVGTEEAWDSRALGANEAFVGVADASDTAAVDAALGLQPISIRLHKSLIEDFKIIAQFHGLGYQTLMRQVLVRFADCEKKQLIREYAAETARRKTEEAETPRAATG